VKKNALVRTVDKPKNMTVNRNVKIIFLQQVVQSVSDCFLRSESISVITALYHE